MVCSLCWKPEGFVNLIANLRKKHQKGSLQYGFIEYFEKEYCKYLKNKMLDYTNIEQHRANSCLENYICNATWADLVEGLRNEEERVYKELIEKEKKGETFQSSSNFNKKFIPPWSHAALSKAKKSQIPTYLPQKQSNDSVNQTVKLPPTVGFLY